MRRAAYHQGTHDQYGAERSGVRERGRRRDEDRSALRYPRYPPAHRRAGRRWRALVDLMRSGHVEYGDGVPRQLAALWVDDVTTAPPWWADTDDPIHDHPIADVLFGVAAS